MIFITTYKIRPFLTKAETSELLGVFAKEGPGPAQRRTTWPPTAAMAW